MAQAVELVTHLAADPSGVRLGILSTSGEKSALLADIARSIGITLPHFEESTASRLRRHLHLSPDAPIGNPVDTGMGFRSTLEYSDMYRDCLKAVDDDCSIDIIVVEEDTHGPRGAALSANRAIVATVAEVAQSLRKAVVVVSGRSATPAAEITETAHANGLPVLQGFRPSLSVIDRFGEYLSAPASTDDSLPLTSSEESRRSTLAGILSSSASTSGLLDPVLTQRLLTLYDLPTPATRIAHTRDEAVRHASEIGFPVALKIVSPDILHKSDVHGVRLDLRSPVEVGDAYEMMIETVRETVPTASIAGVAVAKHVLSSIELMMGTKFDEDFGPVVVLALGGVLVDLLGEPTIVLPPVSSAKAEAALRSFHGHELLSGYRGSPRSDLARLGSSLMKVGELARHAGDRIESIDLNPVLVSEEFPAGCFVDARVVLNGRRTL
jgi:acetate---CoA ligase (ADP-forming)